MPKKTRGRDGVYERDGYPGYWNSYVDEFGKRRQQYGGPTVTQAREKREETGNPNDASNFAPVE
jgi:hypothetical protein